MRGQFNTNHELLGYLYADNYIDKAISHYERAIQLIKSKIGKQTLTKEIERLQRTEQQVTRLKHGYGRAFFSMFATSIIPE